VDAPVAVKVIFLTYAYPPLKYPRSIQIARLVKYSSHEIRVVCCDDDSPKDFSIAGDVEGKPAEVVTVAKKPFSFFKPAHLLDWMLLPDQHRSWALGAADFLLRSSQVAPGDVLVTFGQPMSVHLAGLKIKRATGVPWIAHFSDPWADSPYRHGVIKGWLNNIMERLVISGADRLIFTSQETVELTMSKYPTPWGDKAVVIPHAYDPSRYRKTPTECDGFNLRYVGNFYGTRTPEPLIRALITLYQDRPEILRGVCFELIGHSESRIKIPPELPPGLLSICPPVDYSTSLELMRSADVLLVIDAPFERSVFLPSKLIDYIGAARPILAITPPGPAAELVTHLGGLVADPRNPCEIAERLTSAIKYFRETQPQFWGPESVRKKFEASAVASRMDRLINELDPTAHQDGSH
jgi:glycosyltransferase involved in cell wall biosynthesis